ncbi:hypothetical protein UFOVP386_27 [uncultured Caudovirales phage]|uniref:Uncharacterized protein n=1 Tax=uncultured Caudovirales phage TaxID=2100421 RepID=A0A6J7X6X0_9CAUD|nr:hypothetical protein UFOVP386_27 [uncultured Caudovirales phage]
MKAKDIKISLYGDYSRYNVGQYIDYMTNSGSELNRIMAITGLKRDEAVKLSPGQMNELIEFFEAIIKNPVASFKQKWNHNGITYGFHPFLDGLSFAEWLDLNKCMKDFPKSLDEVLAILYRPIKMELYDKYEIEDYDYSAMQGRKKIFREMPLHHANACMLFFSIIRKRLLIVFQEHLEEETLEQMEIAMKMMEEELTKHQS